jgi:hypothetical protein
VARNDPTDTGGLFIGRRPGTAPLRLRPRPDGDLSTRRRRRFDEAFAAAVLFCQVVLCVSLWLPVPLAALWVGSQVVPFTSELVGIAVAGVVVMAMLVLILVVLRRLDHVWKLARRAAGHDQKRGMLERVFVATLIVAVSAFLVWFLIIAGPGSMLVPERPA